MEGLVLAKLAVLVMMFLGAWLIPVGFLKAWCGLTFFILCFLFINWYAYDHRLKKAGKQTGAHRWRN
jgi:uncharacterized membrane protein